MAIDIVAIGEPLYELSQQPDGQFLPGFGGDTSNVAIAAARLGVKAAYVTKLGRDAFGDAIAALWRAEGVEASHVTRHETAPTGLYLVTHSAAGHRFSYCRKDSAASLMTADDIPHDLIRTAKFLHVSGISQAISASARNAVAQAIALAREAGVRVSYDTNLRLLLWPTEEAGGPVEEAISQASITKTSLDDARALFGLGDPAAIAARLLQLGSENALVTLGAEGVFVATKMEQRKIPAFAVEAMDATGAGDAFTGALLAELVGGVGLFDAARFANAAAALSTRGYGAVAPLPQRDEVEALFPPPPRSGGKGGA